MRRAVCVLALSFVPFGASAQDPQPAPSAAEPTKHTGAPVGQFSLGSLVVTPTLKIGSLAVDTNVRFLNKREADFVASGGPGLDLALPFLDHWKIDVQGSSEYFYFHRLRELRRWTGGGTAALLWAGTGTRASISTRAARDFSRPNLEVDSRMVSTQTNLAGTLERDLGRLTLSATAAFDRSKVDSGQQYRGADLAAVLSTDRISVRPEFRLRLTPFSSLLLEGAFNDTRFPSATLRNYTEERVGAGFRTSGLFKGQVAGGVQINRLSAGGASSTRPYVRGDLSQQAGSHFTFKEMYTQESSISAFAVEGGLPTFRRRALTIDIGIRFSSRVDMRLGGVRERILSDGLVSVVLDNGATAVAKRDDTAYILHSDVGMRLGRARLSVFASFTTRESLYFSDFGIDGLQAGARVEYSPSR